MTRFCAVCNKPWGFGSNPFYFTLKVSSHEMQKEVFVCESCKPNVDAGDTPFTRVSAPGFATPQQERRFWHNETPLPPDQALDPSQMPLSNYPLIKDFEVVVLCWIHPQESGKEAWHASARLISSSRGYLTYALPVDLSYPDFIFPQGNFDQPYHFEAGWDTFYTCIAEQDEFVYILTDNEEFMLDDHGNRIHLYHAWFKVEKSLYYTHWRQAIYLARSLFAAQK